MHNLKTLFVVSFCLLLQYGSFGQNFGHFYSQNFSPKTYKGSAQNWNIKQINNGLVYVANNSGILEFDGNQWRILQTTKKTPVRSLHLHTNNKLYAGSIGDFGFVNEDENGQTQYKSISHKLDSTIKFSEVWSINSLGDTLAFLTDNYLFLYNNETFRTIKKTGSQYFFLSYSVHNSLFVQEVNKGLFRWHSDSLQLIEGSDKFKRHEIYAMLPYSKNALIVSKRGFYEYNFQTNSIDSLPAFAQTYSTIKKYRIYNAIRLHSGNYLITTKTGGAFLLNASGAIINTINKQRGIQDNKVYAAFEDQQHNIWLALGNGISHVESSLPLTRYTSAMGLHGTVYKTVKHNNILYVATASGLFTVDKNNIAPIKNVHSQVWDLQFFVHKNKNRTDTLLFACGKAGIFEINEHTAQKLLLSPECFSMSQINNNTALIGGERGALIMEYSATNWTFSDRIKGIQADIRSIAKENDSTFWLGKRFNGNLRLRLSGSLPSPINETDITKYVRIDTFYHNKGLPKTQNIFPVNHNDSILFQTVKGMYFYNLETDSINSNHNFNKLLYTDSTSVFPFCSAEGIVSFFQYSPTKRHSNLLLTSNGREKLIQTPFFRHDNINMKSLYISSDSILWLGGSSGLFRYDIRKEKDFDIPFNCFVRQVTCDTTTIYAGGKTSYLKQKIDYSQNDLAFEFSSPYFEASKLTRFSYKLKGQDKKWSKWTTTARKEYTNLHEGDYTFLVKSKNVYDKESKVGRFSFSVAPPLHRSLFAYFIYLVLLTFAFITSIRLYTKRLRTHKERLEKLIRERTYEITTQNNRILQINEELQQQQEEILAQRDNLEDLNHELSEKNTVISKSSSQVNASITYASRIQQAILPTQSILKQHVRSFFLLWQPRDVVSGDFYWFRHVSTKQSNYLVLAAVDCTGHGVPGAFVSMLGFAFLNEIFQDHSIWEQEQPAAYILNTLRQKVKQSLKQTGAQGESKDGMDISLCIVDQETKLMEYAGANSPIFIIRNVEQLQFEQNDRVKTMTNNRFQLSHFVAQAQPIGIFLKETPFVSTTIQLQENDKLYLFSDGYTDQLGGLHGRKFMIKNFKKLLLEIADIPMEKQKQLIVDKHNKWCTGAIAQVDDILVIGIDI